MKENIRHGKLTTIKKIQGRKKNPYRPAKWLCRCDCGNEKILMECHLYGRGIKSCGCLDFKGKSYCDKENYIQIMKDKIQKNISINDSECWIWRGAKHRQGYGNISFNKKNQLLHRVAWQIYKGDIPGNLLVCHKCDVTSCCNPEHLFLGTQQDNVDDAVTKKKFEKRAKLKRRNKLNYEQVQEIKKLHSLGSTRKELREKFSVGETCIAKILTGVSWKINWTQEL